MWSVWATKGGVGCSVVAAGLGLLAARHRPAVLVDLGGDLLPILGAAPDPTDHNGEVDRPDAFGVADWLVAERPPPDALARLEIPVAPRLSVLPLGGRRLPPASRARPSGPHRPPAIDYGDSVEVLARVLAAERRVVVVDVGIATDRYEPLLDRCRRSLLVTRACYLALRRRPVDMAPDRAVLVREPGRSLRPADVSAAIGCPVGAVVDWDPAVARAVDAGVLARRLPRSLRPLRSLLAPAGARHSNPGATSHDRLGGGTGP